ncbi:MAG: PAS domain S-box protein [Proteobacteria bacterium]|nr:PAS domain S-box protein [Pseudomonadota bacterium]
MISKLNKEELEHRIQELERQLACLKQMEIDIIIERNFSNSVLDCLPGIFYLYDEDGNIIRWNKNHEDLTGFSAEEIKQRKNLDWFDGSDKDLIADRAKECFVKGKSYAQADLIIKNGSKVPFYFTAFRMTINDKNFLIGMGIDITTLKQTEEELKKAHAELENRVEERTLELMQANARLSKEIEDRNKAEEKLKILRGLLPICANCKKIRDDKGSWNQIETYIKNHSEAEFTHGICQDCAKLLYPDFAEY